MEVEEYFWKMANSDSADEVKELRDMWCNDKDRTYAADGPSNVFSVWLEASGLRAVTLGHAHFVGTVESRMRDLMRVVEGYRE